MSAIAHPLAEGENYRRWIECSRKRPFGSRKIAKEQATGALKRYGIRLGIYNCPHCGQWHTYTLR